jgi:hypothetical protein
MIALNNSGGNTPRQKPPKVLTDLVMIRQIRERKRKLAALRAMIAEREGRDSR